MLIIYHKNIMFYFSILIVIAIIALLLILYKLYKIQNNISNINNNLEFAYTPIKNTTEVIPKIIIQTWKSNTIPNKYLQLISKN
jgi:mannosyltransferase OCH1-like enzyme